MKFSFFHSVAAMLLASSPLIRAQDEICRGSCEEDDDGNKFKIQVICIVEDDEGFHLQMSAQKVVE